MLEYAHWQQQKWLKEQANKYSSGLKTAPLLGLLSESMSTTKFDALIADLSKALTATIYRKYHAVASKSHLCDRMMMVTAGRAHIASFQQDISIGECVGFTCLIAHKWAEVVVALENVECLEITRDIFKEILGRHGAYEKMVFLTLCTLHPKAMPTNAVRRCYHQLGGLNTPPLYPVNKYSWRVNFAPEKAQPGDPPPKVKQTQRTKRAAEKTAQLAALRRPPTAVPAPTADDTEYEEPDSPTGSSGTEEAIVSLQHRLRMLAPSTRISSSSGRSSTNGDGKGLLRRKNRPRTAIAVAAVASLHAARRTAEGKPHAPPILHSAKMFAATAP